MNIKLKKINIPRKCIFITLLVLVFIVFLINNENIIYNIGKIKEENEMATSYNSVSDFSKARWTEIQNSIFGEGVASSVTDTKLKTADVIENNPYFNWTDTSDLQLVSWSGTQNNSNGVALSDADFYDETGSVPTETYNYSTAVDGGGTSKRDVTYYVYNVDTAEKLVYVIAKKSTTTNNIKINITKDIDMGGRYNKLLSTYTISKGTNLFYIEGNNHTIYNLNTTKGLIGTIKSGFVAKNLNFKSSKIVGSTTSTGIFGGIDNSYRGIFLDNIKIDGFFSQNPAGTCAVLTGVFYASNAYLRNCSIENAYVRGNGGHVGSFIAIACSGVDSPVKYNASIPDVPEATFGNTDTAIGSDNPRYPIIIENSYSIDSEVHSTSGHSGGFISCDGGGIIVKNCFTNNSMYGEGQTGGFIGSQISVTTSEEIKSHGRQIDDAGNSTIAAYFENCYSSGVVEGKKEIGGFVGNDAQVNRGEVGGASIYKNCYSTTMTGMDYSGTYVGGFVGNANNITPNVTVDGYGTFTGSLYLNCYAAGEVGNIGTNTNINTAKSKYIGGFMGGYNSNTASIGNIYNCFYDKQTTGMREVAVGLAGNNGTCQLKGVTGVYTKASEVKGVQGLTDIDMQDGSAWMYREGYYPQLRAFTDLSSSNFSNSGMVESYSAASAATVFLDHWDKIMNKSGNIENDVDAQNIYDTIRDITSEFELTSNANSSSPGYDLTWAVDSETNKIKGYKEELNITEEDGTVKTIPVLSIQNPVKNQIEGTTFGLDSADIYKCYDFAPGKSWVKIIVENTLEESVYGTRKLRLLPTAYIDAGNYTEIKLITDNGDENRVIKNEVEVEGKAEISDIYKHAEDTMYVITDESKLANNKVVYPGQVVSKDKNATNLFALWNRYPSDLNSSEKTTEKFDGMYNQALIGNSQNTGLAKVEVYSLGVAYREIETEEGIVTVPVIDYDKEKRITSNALEDAKWRGEALFDKQDAGWYELKYYWRLNDGRYLTDSKIVVIKGNQISATLNNIVIKGEEDYTNENLKITPDIKQNTEDKGDLSLDYSKSEEEKREVGTTIKENGTVEKKIKINEFVDDTLIAGWKNDERYKLIDLKVEVSRDGAAWVTLPLDLEISNTAEYTYTNQNWQVKQYTDTKEYYIDPTGEPIETTLRAEYEEADENNNDYTRFKFLVDSGESSDTITNSNIRVTATFSPKEEITITKKWLDNNNINNLRPTSIVLKVIGSDSKEYSQEVTGNELTDEGWSNTFELASYDVNEEKIEYTIDEEINSELYTKEIDEENNIITNEIVKYKVTTQVEGQGGTISGQEDEIYEEVVKSMSNTKEIIVTPEEGFEISSIKINGVEQELPAYSERANPYTLPQFTSISEDKNIVVTFRENKTNVSVIKNWIDNSNEAQKRPSSIIIELYANRVYTQEYRVTDTTENTQNYTFGNLPKYDENGNEIEYTIKEKECNLGDLQFYKKVVDNSTYTVTNTFEVPDEKINVEYTKKWEDNSNVNGKRPTSIKAQLKNGESIVQEVIISGSTNEWKYTFENVKKYDSLGNEIEYSVDEAEVNIGDLYFYEKTIDNETKTVTNTFKVPDEKIEITAQKEWKNEVTLSKRPESVILVIKSAGVEIQSKEVSESSDWKATFTDLPKYNEKGNEISYIVDEKEKNEGDLKFYIKTVDNSTYTVTNTFEVPDDRITYTVDKEWIDNSNEAQKRPNSIIVDLYANGSVIRSQQIATSQNDRQEYIFEDLAKYDESGEEIEYKIDEREVNTGELYFYRKEINGNVITNTFTVPDEKVNVEATKIWEDNLNEKGKRPASIIINLYGNGVLTQSYEVTDTSEDVQNHTFENLPKYNSLGNIISYTVEEQEVNVEDLKFYISTVDNTTNTITNVFKVPDEKVTVTGTKLWEDSSNVARKRPSSIVIELYANGNILKSQQLTITQDRQEFSFNNLDKYDENGNEIVYTIDEKELNEGDLKFYTKSLDSTTNTITNTFEVPDEKVSISVNKVWVDNNNENGKRPSTLKLIVRKGAEEVASYIIPDTSNENQTYIFENLPKYNELGNEIVYTIDEEEVNEGDLEFYTKQISGTTITNTFTVPTDKVSYTATKEWNDNDDYAKKRPESVIVVILDGTTQIQEKTLSESNGWKCEFKDLPKYNSSGEKISYVLAEKESTLGDLYFYETEIDNGNIKLTNTFRVPDERASIKATKIWEDNNNEAGKRPSSIEIELYANGVYNQSYVITDTSENTQEYTFENLPKYDSLGNEIVYTVDEKETNTDDLKFYKKEVSGTTIKNTFEVPDEKVAVNGTKIWSDNSNAARKRPSSIVVELYANGEYKLNQVVADTSLSDTQEYTFENLPKYDSLGNEIVYTVDEKELNEGDLKFYTKEIIGTTITNTFEVPNEKTSVKVTKNWVDTNNKAGKRPSSIEIELYANGVYNKSYEITDTSENTQEYTFEDLDKYDSLGNVISYTIDEKEVNEKDLKFYSKNINGNTITNTFRVPDEKKEYEVTKIWDDSSNINGKRPSTITLELYGNGTYKESGTIADTSENTQKYTFENLAKYDSLGNEIEYTIKEKETAVGDLKFYTNSISGNVITNIFTVPDEKVEVTISKTWVDNSNEAGKRPSSIIIELYANGVYNQSQVITDTSEDIQNLTFENLAKYDEKGNEVVYTTDEKEVNEGELKFYKKTISGKKITNTFTVPNEKVSVKVKKIWVDNSTIRRPQSIKFVLTDETNTRVSEKVVNTEMIESTQEYTFENLTKYDSLGNEKEYYVSEEEVKENDLYFYNTTIDNTTKTITNTFVLPEDRISKTVTKVWDDDNNKARKRPSSVILQIKNGEIIVASKTVTSALNWTNEFTDLPKYDEIGQEIEYTIDEKESNTDDLKFYEKKIDNENGIITNTFRVPDEKVRIEVLKVWEDNLNEANRRPQSILVDVKNGTQTVRTEEITGTLDTWSYTIENLSKYDENGDIIRYTIDERAKNTGELIAYTKQVKGYTITNTIKKYEVTTQVDGDGGTISGQEMSPYENVLYGNNSIKEIIIRPEYGYKISSIKVNGSEVEFRADENGEYTMPQFTNVTENKNVVVTFEKKDTSVIVKHQSEEGVDLVEPERIDGKVGDSYTTAEKDFEDYYTKTIPDNANGEMTEEQIEVIYVYKLVNGTITVTKVDKDDSNIRLEGATFKIEKIDENGNVDTEFTEQDKTTGNTGTVEFEQLLVGKYRITEVKAPQGYELAKESIEVEITKENANQQIEAKDKLKLILPETGAKNYTIIISLFGAIVMLLSFRKMIKSN